MTQKLDNLQAALEAALGGRIKKFKRERGEITITIAASDWFEVAKQLRDDSRLRFEQLIDLCGLDMSAYKDEPNDGPRYCVVSHLLSLSHNRRLRVRTFAPDDDFPVVPSVIDIWPSVNWFEREAFDLYGIMFPGHPDLRRLLTDYGFVGHPFRKDFPLSGYVEMRYDPEQARVIYQPVTIEPREVTPRVVREENYAENE